MSMTVFELMATLGLNTTEFEKGVNTSEEKATSLGSKIAGAAKVGAAAFAAVSGAAVATGAGLAKSVGGIAEYGDNIDKMAQKMGMSTDAYQEWDAIMQHSGTSIETMKTSMKTLANAAETGKDAFEKLGISQEEVATLSQEDLFAKTIEGLQNVQDDTERTYLAGQLLGKGATELGALMNTSAEDTEKMRQRVHELGGVMSEDAVKASAAYQDSLQDMQTAFSGLKRMALTEFLPGMTTVMDGVTALFSGEDGGAKIAEGVNQILDTIGSALPKFVSKVGTIVKAIGQAIFDHMPDIIDHIPTIIGKIVEFISNNLPTIVSSGIQIVVAIATGLIEAIPKLMESIPKIVSAIGSALKEVNWLEIGKSLIEGFLAIGKAGLDVILSIDWMQLGIDVISSIGEGIASLVAAIPDALKDIGESAYNFVKDIDWHGLGSGLTTTIKDGIQSVANTVTNALKTMGETGASLVKNIDWHNVGTSIVNFIKGGLDLLFHEIPNKLKEIGADAWKKVSDIDWLDLGKNIVLGIAQGLWDNVKEVINAVTGVVGNAIDAARNFLQSNSPSKKTRDLIGKPMAQGIGVGFESNMPVKEMQDALQNAMDIVGDVDMDQLENDFAELMGMPSEGFGSDEFSIDTIDIKDDGRSNQYPADNITFNVYAKEHQDEKMIAEEVMRLFTLWDNQRKRAFA